MNARYITAKEMNELVDPADGCLRCTIRLLQVELIDERPQLVMYVEEDPRGIIVHRKLYEDLTKYYGRNSFADDFFQKAGLQ